MEALFAFVCTFCRELGLASENLGADAMQLIRKLSIYIFTLHGSGVFIVVRRIQLFGLAKLCVRASS
jgi:hypothetical protein